MWNASGTEWVCWRSLKRRGYKNGKIIFPLRRTDFLNHLFPGSRRLMEIADIIEEVPTVCWCGRRAQCNTRYADGKIVEDQRNGEITCIR